MVKSLSAEHTRFKNPKAQRASLSWAPFYPVVGEWKGLWWHWEAVWQQIRSTSTTRACKSKSSECLWKNFPFQWPLDSCTEFQVTRRKTQRERAALECFPFILFLQKTPSSLAALTLRTGCSVLDKAKKWDPRSQNISFIFPLSDSLRAKMSLCGQLRYETSHWASEIQDCSDDSQTPFYFFFHLGLEYMLSSWYMQSHSIEGGKEPCPVVFSWPHPGEAVWQGNYKAVCLWILKGLVLTIGFVPLKNLGWHGWQEPGMT